MSFTLTALTASQRFWEEDIMPRHVRTALLLVAIVALYPHGSSAAWNYRIGEQAPEFELQALDGKIHRFVDLKGSWVVVTFMTTWCPFCNAAAPHFQRLSQDYGPRGVRTFIVDVHEQPEVVGGWVRKLSLSCPVLLDADGEVATRYAPPPDFVPDLKREEVMIASFMIVDPSGIIRFLALPEDTANFDARLVKLRAALDALMAQQ
jgi:peroxiredoxin